MLSKVLVVGTGVIGASWTALFLKKGVGVLATDPAVGAEERLIEYVKHALQVLGLDVDTCERLIAHRLRFVAKLEPAHLDGVDFVQENGPERADYKTQMFGWLDEHARPHVVLASSSSGLPASSFVSQCSRSPERILIGHPFNPPHLIPLVEVVPHAGTSQDTVTRAVTFYEDLDKKPVVICSETPGFVANRLQAALVHEAYSLVSRGIVSAKDIDDVVTNSIALRWAIQGPFLTKVLGGGGGGTDGFRHHLAHVGKAANEWVADMKSHAFEPTPEANEKLVQSVDLELKSLGDVDLETTRDKFLLEVLESKSKLLCK
ncbi:hypothetical protein OIV83_004851 [Microbotryomycetes sp. JL201]|nr:hypothetical protein OIV83_004851 [Microbotryomycetes sp. JL201]